MTNDERWMTYHEIRTRSANLSPRHIYNCTVLILLLCCIPWFSIVSLHFPRMCLKYGPLYSRFLRAFAWSSAMFLIFLACWVFSGFPSLFHLHDSASSTVQVLLPILVVAFTACWVRLLSSLAVLLVLPVVVAVDLPHQMCCKRMVLLAMAMHAHYDHKCANIRANDVYEIHMQSVTTTHSDRFLPNDLYGPWVLRKTCRSIHSFCKTWLLRCCATASRPFGEEAHGSMSPNEEQAYPMQKRLDKNSQTFMGRNCWISLVQVPKSAWGRSCGLVQSEARKLFFLKTSTCDLTAGFT